ncbi:MAG: hypothetical protein J6Q22_09465 [Prevotella sp.]|nr:hypothetical protein [Prevotella sp.]
MEIKTWIKYEVPYLPQRCRKLRYMECEEHVNVLLKEVPFSKLVLAYEDTSYDGKGKIYRYGGKLWAKAKMPNLPKEDLKRYKVKTPLDWLVWGNGNCSTYFSTRYGEGENATRKAMVSKARKDVAKYILVDGELYEKTCKPEYFILTFGCGNGDGTGLFVSYPARRDCGLHFPATRGEDAVAKAKEIAIGRRDFNSVKNFKKYITVYEGN